ncbi:hypothetical protein ABG067_004226 [Albugo candida]|uniref:Aminoglycoside phosphotransferase domain-containing protein n=1 Tax=Albugo candida TaxID=65357 RepID=A0A024G691_9STRA|nr:unnamed protein product [Albugo candida]|eukprot:CCI42272.1 unnamed protein product [Albugo candida]
MEEGRQVIVKFATKYGKKVHEFCALQGFAPKLLACEKLPSEWFFIVMEKVDQLQLLTVVVDQHRPKILDDLKTIKKRLCDVKFVDGDLREGNVLWDVRSEQVVLIDFDWAGKENKGVYPPFMNNAIKWPDGAESEMPLRVEHEYWFKKLVKRLDV